MLKLALPIVTGPKVIPSVRTARSAPMAALGTPRWRVLVRRDFRNILLHVRGKNTREKTHEASGENSCRSLKSEENPKPALLSSVSDD